jgi:hypothetical protein
VVSEILARIRELVSAGELRTSLHGFRELAADDILLEEVVAGVEVATPIESIRRM